MLDESELVVPEWSVTTAGYPKSAALRGSQVWETIKRQSSSSSAVGRVELDSFQHDHTNSHKVSEKPRDSACAGFSGRSPLTTAGINVGLGM